MTTQIHSGTYQGYAIKEVEYRRSDGLTPEPGMVVIDYSVLKELSLKLDVIPWRGQARQADDPGLISIQTWWKLFGKSTHAAPHKPILPGSGLKLYGQLVLTSAIENGGPVDQVVYEDVYLDNAQEVSRNLANILSHREGEVRINLTDIRSQYHRAGAVLGRINCRLRSGRYDPRTIKKPGKGRRSGGTGTSAEFDGTPWSFSEVIRYLFSQLPGSPIVQTNGLPELPPPEEIDRVGDSTLSVIQDLLDNYRLVAKYQPDGNYLIARRGVKHMNPGEVIREIGRSGERPNWTSYETKTVTYEPVPPVVVVLGRRAVRRLTTSYSPAFEDVDGRIYRLIDIDKVWKGYSIEQVNRQVMAPEMSFHDVPPRQTRRNFESTAQAREVLNAGPVPNLQGLSVSDAAAAQAINSLHHQRRDIMRSQAYRLYVPDMLFEMSENIGAGGAPFIADMDDTAVAWLPALDAPMFEQEIRQLFPGGGVKAKSNAGPLVLVPPIVRGRQVAEVFFTDSVEASKHLRDLKDSRLRELEEIGRAHQLSLDDIIRNIGARELRANAQFERGPATDLRIAQQLWGSIDIDFKLGGRQQRVIETLTVSEVEKEASATQKKKVVEVLASLVALVAKADLDIRRLAGTFRLEGGCHVISNLPIGVIPRTAYTFDTETAFIQFDQPVCVIDPPMVFEGGSATVLTDGAVSATFGHEVNRNEPTDFSSVIFARSEKGKVEACGVNRGTAVKPQVVSAPDLRMYQDDLGFPMNLKACVEQGQRKAEPLLSGELATEGYVTEYSGFVQCALERSVSSIQHVWYGGAAHTFIAINAPGAAMALGSADTPQRFDSETRANQSRKLGDQIGGGGI